MKTAILSTIAILWTQMAIASNHKAAVVIPKIGESSFESFELKTVDSSDGTSTVAVYGKTTYANDCMVKDFKFKRVFQVEDTLHYEVLGANRENKICPKIFQPVSRLYLIDKIQIKNGEPLPKIAVNDVVIN